MEKIEHYVHAFIACEDLMGGIEIQERLLNLMRKYEDKMECGKKKASVSLCICILEDAMLPDLCLGSRKVLQEHALKMVKEVM